jgi:hypothetical protein
MTKLFFPVTPAGTICTWLPAATKEDAWALLLADAAHMPYRTKAEFKLRGYSVREMPAEMAEAFPPESAYKHSTTIKQRQS